VHAVHLCSLKCDAGSSADLYILGDDVMDPAAVPGGRTNVCLAEKADVDQLLQEHWTKKTLLPQLQVARVAELCCGIAEY